MEERHSPMKTKEFNVKILKDMTLDITLGTGVFEPTGTSTEIATAVHGYVDIPGKTLDLGCGSGVVGLALAKSNKTDGILFASDLSEDAVHFLKINAKKHGINVDARAGSVFEPWTNEKFDLIVDDISGVSERIAAISPWFNETACESGEDGTKLVIEAIQQAPKHLNKNGLFFFPILSLSNSDKIVSFANGVFNSVEKISSKQWQMPKEMIIHKEELYKLRETKVINFEEKYGWMLWSTDVYVAKDPK
jgi:methylase of polypeptide subunit release factors